RNENKTEILTLPPFRSPSVSIYFFVVVAIDAKSVGDQRGIDQYSDRLTSAVTCSSMASLRRRLRGIFHVTRSCIFHNLNRNLTIEHHLSIGLIGVLTIMFSECLAGIREKTAACYVVYTCLNSQDSAAGSYTLHGMWVIASS
ncbi:hypothetical protein Btru_077554, partial [Bulinus truncatus]